MLIGCPLVRSLEKFKTQLLPYHGLRALRITQYERKRMRKHFADAALSLQTITKNLILNLDLTILVTYFKLFQKVW